MRGVHRSKPAGEIMDEVMKLVNKGVKELIVIGQDTTYYGLDLFGQRKLASLLTSLASVKELEWVRLMYAYPAKFPHDVLQAFQDNPKICRYMDMPIQHASDSVLKSMRRGITRRATESLIASVREAVPDIALRTTLITGYPNETERDVEELVDFIKTVRFDRLGVFMWTRKRTGQGCTAWAIPFRMTRRKRAGQRSWMRRRRFHAKGTKDASGKLSAQSSNDMKTERISAGRCGTPPK